MNLGEFKEKYPYYAQFDDDELSRALHAKFYPDTDYREFAEAFEVPGYTLGSRLKESFKQGLGQVKLTWDFLANKLERAVTGDESDTGPILAKSAADYARLRGDPKIAEMLQGPDDETWGEAAVSMASYLLHNPSVVATFLAQQVPGIAASLPLGGVGGQIAGRAAASAGLKAAGTAATQAAGFGTTMNSAQTAIMALGSNYADGLDKFGGNRGAAEDYAIRKTASEVPANAVAGAFLGISPLISTVRGQIANVIGQSTAQGIGGMAGAMQAAEAGGDRLSKREALMEFGGEFLTAPVDVAAETLSRGQLEVGVTRPPDERENPPPALPAPGTVPMPMGAGGERTAEQIQAELDAERNATALYQARSEWERARQPVDPVSAIVSADTLDEAIAAAERAVSAPIDLPEMPRTTLERTLGMVALDADMARRARQKDVELRAILESGRDVAVDQANALTQWQGFDIAEPTAMQIAMAKARERMSAMRPENRAPATPGQDAEQRAAIPEPQSEVPIRAETPLETVRPGVASGQEGGVPQPSLGLTVPHETISTPDALQARQQTAGQRGVASEAVRVPPPSSEPESPAVVAGPARATPQSPQAPIGRMAAFKAEVNARRERANALAAELERRVEESGGARAETPIGSIILTPGLSGEKYRVTSLDKDGAPTGHREYSAIHDEKNGLNSAIIEFMGSNTSLVDEPSNGAGHAIQVESAGEVGSHARVDESLGRTAESEGVGLGQQGTQASEEGKAQEIAPPDVRISENAGALRTMAGEAGWAEIGGRIIRDPASNEVTGRTRWIPKAEWWPGRPDGISAKDFKDAVERAIAGQPLRAKQRRAIDYALDYLHEQETRHALSAEEQKAEAGIERIAEDVLTREFSPEAWGTMSEAEKEAELDDIFGPESRSEPTRESEAEGGQAGSQERAAEDSQARGQAEDGRQERSEARAGLILEQQTEADLGERERERNAEESRRKAENTAAEAKRKADAERDNFLLTGSDRNADANPGQGDIFSTPPPQAAATQTETPAPAGVSASDDREAYLRDPVTVAVRNLEEVRDRKPRPIRKLYGEVGPTPEQAAEHAEQVRQWNADMRRARRAMQAAREEKARQQDDEGRRAADSARADEERAAEDPDSTEALAKRYDLAGITVERPGVVRGRRQEVMVSQQADVALREIDEQISVARALLDCVRR